MKINNLFNKVEAAETKLLDSQFISPVIHGSRVRVKILGLVHEFKVTSGFQGWAILKPISSTEAKIIGSPSFREISHYLAQFPRLRLVLSGKQNDFWLGLHIQVHSYAHSEIIQSPVLLASGVELFDSIIARFDGANPWFQMRDSRSNPAMAEYLRESLEQKIPLDKLKKPGLNPVHRKAYEWQTFLREKKIGELTLDKIKRAVDHGGGEFKSYIEREDSYTVVFALGDEDFRTTVRKDNFSVISAGICLDGHDRKFDLQSLIGVVREGQEKEVIHRMDGEE